VVVVEGKFCDKTLESNCKFSQESLEVQQLEVVLPAAEWHLDAVRWLLVEDFVIARIQPLEFPS